VEIFLFFASLAVKKRIEPKKEPGTERYSAQSPVDYQHALNRGLRPKNIMGLRPRLFFRSLTPVSEITDA